MSTQNHVQNLTRRGKEAVKRPVRRGYITEPSAKNYHLSSNAHSEKKCRAYHPPELEKWAKKELEKKAKEEEEQEKNTREQAELKAFLDKEKPKMEMENQDLRQRVQDLEAKLMLARNTPTQVPFQEVQQGQGIQEQLSQIQATLQQLRIQPLQMTPQPMQMQAMPYREPPQMQQLQWQQNQLPRQN